MVSNSSEGAVLEQWRVHVGRQGRSKVSGFRINKLQTERAHTMIWKWKPPQRFTKTTTRRSMAQ